MQSEVPVGKAEAILVLQDCMFGNKGDVLERYTGEPKIRALAEGVTKRIDNQTFVNDNCSVILKEEHVIKNQAMFCPIRLH